MAEGGRVSGFSSSPDNLASKTMAGASNLLKLLPTGTVIVFRFLSPLLTNNGDRHLANKFAAGALLILCAASCASSCFTDSFSGPDGRTYCGIATPGGMLVFGGLSSPVDLSTYRLRFGDFIHAFFSVFVLCVVALLKALATALLPAVGAVSGFVFIIVPNKRSGIGHAEVPTPRRAK
ncbi:unnamed protein product [Victoria cruziana]